MENIENAQQYLTVLQKNVELTEIETVYNNSNLSLFSNGVRFKYKDSFFEIYKVSNAFIEEMSDSRLIFYYENTYTFTTSEFALDVDFTERVNARYDLYVNDNFILFKSDNSIDIDFVKTNHKLLNAYYEVKI